MISCSVPSEGTRLPSDQAHHIDCMLLPSQVLGWILMCSASHAHDCYDLSSRTPSMLSHAAVSFWPQAVRSIIHTQLCGPIRRGFPDLSLTETLHRQRGVKVITSTACLITDSVFLLTTVIASFLSPSRNDCLMDRSRRTSPVLPSVTIRIPAISCSDKADVRKSQ